MDCIPVETEDAVRCVACSEELIPERAEYPERDSNGDVLCDECYCEHYHFRCCLCQNCGDVSDQHNMIVVTEDVQGLAATVSPGIYKVILAPYFGDGIIEMRLYPDALDRIADVPEGVDTDPFPCGHLCYECQQLFT